MDKFYKEWLEDTRRKKVENARKLISENNLDLLMQECSFENYKTEKKWQKIAKEKAETYAQNPKGWFFIGGKTGAGKTHLCTAIVNELFKKKIPSLYMLWRNDIASLKFLPGQDLESRYRNLRKYCNVQCLYIDDLFKGKVSETDINITYEIINSRYNSRKLTIISSEMQLADILEEDAAIAGRIKERSGENVINIANKAENNYRLK